MALWGARSPDSGRLVESLQPPIGLPRERPFGRAFADATSMTPAAERRLRSLCLLGIPILGLFTFSGLLDYDPFPFERPGQDDLEDWFFRNTGQSPALIFGLAACLLFPRFAALKSALARPRGGQVTGAILLVASAALYGWSLYVAADDLLLIALVLACLGTGATLGGLSGLRAVFLPSTFLLLLIPIPAILVNQVVYPLQLATAEASTQILNDVLGIPATRYGILVTTELRTFQVIESCAGLRMMATMLMAAIVYADLFQRSRKETTLLLILSPLVAAIANLARVISLMINPYGDIVEVHTTQGIAMTVGGVLLLAALDFALSRIFPASPGYLLRWNVEARGEPDRPDPAPSRLRSLAPLVVLALLGLGSRAIVPWQPERLVWWAPSKIPNDLPGWTAEPTAVDRDAVGSALPNHWIRRNYSKGNMRIDTYVGTDNLQGRETSLLSPKTVLPESGFDILEQSILAVDGVDGPVQASLLRREFEQVLSYRWVMGASSLWVEAPRAFLAVDRSDWVGERRLILVRLSTRVRNIPGGRIQANAELGDFARVLAPWLEKIAVPEPLGGAVGQAPETLPR